MTSFTVTPQSLDALAGSLGQVASELNSIASRLASGDAAAAGDPGLVEAVSSYLHCWGTGVGNVSDWLNQVQTALHNAAAGYSDTDSAVSGALGR